METLKIFGIGTEDGKKIIHRLGYTLVNEHEKLSSWKLSVTELVGERHIGPCLSSSLGGIGGNITTGILPSLIIRRSLCIYLTSVTRSNYSAYNFRRLTKGTELNRETRLSRVLRCIASFFILANKNKIKICKRGCLSYRYYFLLTFLLLGFESKA